MGYVSLLAGITVPNEASERLHGSFGFREVGRFERVGWKFGRWHDVAYWEVQLVEDPAAGPPDRIRDVQEVKVES